MTGNTLTLDQARDLAHALRDEIGKVVVGQDAVVEEVLIVLLAGGHALLEGVPGLGKTLLVRSLASALELSFSRVQFTPDLMPADIVGTQVLIESDGGRRALEFRKGPVFTQVLLADEINRATPKTQSALLEAMQEGQVTAGGTTHPLPRPFFVLATENPIEMEGTFPLPEAQLDRFLLKLHVPFPTLAELDAIVDRTTGVAAPSIARRASAADVLALHHLVREVLVAQAVKHYALRLVMATHPETQDAPAETRRFVRYGASPRGAQALILAAKARAVLHGRANAAFEDVAAVALSALRHRVLVNYEAEAEGLSADALVSRLIAQIPTIAGERGRELTEAAGRA